ncbi:beta-galactosidase [Opitutaceae bacterium TAV1]|nr:beta-galactosidase [Opitutaceae bacterium TAV1]
MIMPRILPFIIVASLVAAYESMAQDLPVASRNLLKNAGFEDGRDNWYWGVNNEAKATSVVDTEVAHSGSRSLRITNETAQKPHVYGGLHQTVRDLSPGTEYLISVWVKGKNAGRSLIGGGKGWTLRRQLPTGTYDWQRVELRYTTGSASESFELILLTEDITEALWVDDVTFQSIGPAPIDPLGSSNPVSNPGFEAGTLQHWSWGVNKGAQAAATADRTESHSGNYSLKLTNSSHYAPHVYGILRQRIRNLKPHSRYTLSAWVKATDADRGWIGGGPGWKVRFRYPSGTYDWQRITTTIETGDSDSFDLVIVTEGPTKALWVDDISIQETISDKQADRARLFVPSVNEGIPPGTRFYPVFPASPDLSPPLVKIRSEEQPVFGADIAMTSSPRGLFFSINILDSDPFKTAEGEMIWNGDSIQIAFDTSGATGEQGNTNTYYEIGFAWSGQGPVATYAWVGNFTWAGVKATGRKTDSGYALDITIPWRNLSINPAYLPRDIGINVVVNDRGAEGRRRYAEWTPSTARTKNAAFFARAFFVPLNSSRINVLIPAQAMYDQEHDITGRLIEYSLEDIPISQLSIATAPCIQESTTASNPGAALAELPLPALESGHIRQTHFWLSARNFEHEGVYEIHAMAKSAATATPTSAATATILRTDLQTRIADELALTRERVAKAREKWRVSASTNPYARLRIAVIERFFARVEANHKRPELQSWCLLQLEELDALLADSESAQPPSGVLSFPPLPRRVAIGEDGIFRDADTGVPFYFYGYGHFAQAFRDIPLLSKLGSTLIQQEKGPSNLKQNGEIHYSTREFIHELLNRGEAAGTKVDFLLSPHYMPGYVFEASPDARLAGASGFSRYSIDHPAIRGKLRDWIRTVIPLLRDSPALLSVCLANEPTYAHSGREPCSHAAWIAYLEKTHGTIARLNAVYGTVYANFEAVPAPEPVRPDGLEQQRAWFDWVRFNQHHLAEWIRWMNDEVKSVAPEILTHAKVMANIFKRSFLAQGTDPELICAVTDIAGNDAWAYSGASNGYAYDWQSAQMWYDLLHSFQGQPVYNSENHFIRDSAPAVHIPPAHTRSVLWQGAIHHQGATAMWVWDEPRDHDTSGNISLRPANVWAAGKTLLDLRRLAPEVAALSSARARAALLYSVPSIFWEETYTPTATAAYSALMFSGLPVTFISENQLATGIRSHANEKVDTLILPRSTHVSEAAISGIRQFIEQGGRVLAIGADNLAFNEYDQKHTVDFEKLSIKNIPVSAQDTADDRAVRNVAQALRPFLSQEYAWRLQDANSGNTAWGVEWRAVPYKDGHLLSMANMTTEPVHVRLEGPNDDAWSIVDLFSNQPVSSRKIELVPMEPHLFFVK